MLPRPQEARVVHILCDTRTQLITTLLSYPKFLFGRECWSYQLIQRCCDTEGYHPHKLITDLM